MDDADFGRIAEAIDDGGCLAFLGAGASADCTLSDGTEVPGLPTGGRLAQELAKSAGLENGANIDLLQAAEDFLHVKNGHRELLQKELRKHINVDCEPRPIHHALAHLSKIRLALTSNYDVLLEEALRSVRPRRPLTLHVHDPTNPKTGHFTGPILPEDFEDAGLVFHKMHGSIDQPDTLVVTTSDYIRYLIDLANVDRGMPEYFRKTMLPRHSLLFLGYSLNDWNFRVIWEGVLSNRLARRDRRESYALVKSATSSEKSYWARRNVTILEEDLTRFAERLAAHYGFDLPELGGAP